ncbi:MAG: Crp/Fnr family transcriptional regulator [Acidobacteriota bacterium]
MKPLLDNVSISLRSSLQLAGRERMFCEGQEIFAESERASDLPVVLSGKIKMLHYLEPGKEVIIGIFEDGETFAVPAVFDGGLYPASAVAMAKSRLLLIDRDRFLELLRDSSEFSLAILSWMTAMLRQKTATIQNLAHASPEYRVVNVLIQLASTEDPFGGPIRITLRREDIANMAGLTTETTIRVIRRLAAKGLFVIDHGKILIDSVDELKRLVEN